MRFMSSQEGIVVGKELSTRRAYSTCLPIGGRSAKLVVRANSEAHFHIFPSLAPELHGILHALTLDITAFVRQDVRRCGGGARCP